MCYQGLFGPISSSVFSNFMSVLPQVQPQAHLSASLSLLRSPQAVGLGLKSVPSVTRTRWTQSSMPVGTCVCATLAVSNSRRCPMPAVPSVGDRSKTSSRPIVARKGEARHTASLKTGKIYGQ